MKYIYYVINIFGGMNIDIVFMNLTKLKNIRLMSKIPTQYLQA